jgi:TolB-like protein
VSLFAELKRRKVIRVAVVYAATAFAVLQAADIMLPQMGVPEWGLSLVVALVVLGFPIALVLGWALEVTPDGIKRTEAVSDEPSKEGGPGAPDETPALLGKRTVLASALLVAVGIGLGAGWLLKPGTDDLKEPISGDSPTTSAAVAPAAKAVPAAPAEPTASGAARQPGLIAVLPFRNRSAREEDAFFAEGVHDDLLTQLSKVAAFKVISRTSMMRYADSTLSIPQIAAELGAAVVLEGAVQRAGDQVRVNVQLIDGASDVHIWAENYDRALTTETIFAIQADIAQAVADAMQVALSPEESSTLRAGSTQNLEAYEAYLRGTLWSGIGSISTENSQQAIAAFDRAIELDLNFAEAYARKARTQLLSFWLAVGPRSWREDARESLAAAQRLAPDNIETLMAQAYEYYLGQLDYARADATLQKILARVPDHAEALEGSAYVARRDGRFDDAFKAFERALAIDPQAVDVITALVEMLFMVRGDFDDAKAMAQRARRLGADTRAREIWIEEARGDLEAAWAEVDGPLSNFVSLPARIAIKSRDPERIALALSPALWPEDRRSPGDFPEAYAMIEAEAMLVLGRQAEATRLLAGIQQRQAQRSDPYPSRWLGNAYYQPCDLPGMLGDLEGVRAAEADFLQNARRDIWGSRGTHVSLAVAFAGAGDPDRALHYLELLVETFGPHTYAWFSPEPGLDAVRTHPRFLALAARYEAWREARGGG